MTAMQWLLRDEEHEVIMERVRNTYVATWHCAMDENQDASAYADTPEAAIEAVARAEGWTGEEAQP